LIISTVLDNLFLASLQHLAANRNRSKEGNSSCQNVNVLVNKGYDLMNLDYIT